MIKSFWKICIAGLFVLVPAWTTLLILSTLFKTLDRLVGRYMTDPIPGLGLLLLIVLVLAVGFIASHFIGQTIMRQLEERLERIPLVKSIYLTIKGMTDLLNFRARFGNSRVVAFPFPRDGLWALGFVMGIAPTTLQVTPSKPLYMIFVPTAIHPFTGYLAFVAEQDLRPIDLPPEEAMKMEFSAGFYKPRQGWLSAPKTTT